MFLWRQEDTSSLRLFSVDSSGRQMIRNFSLRQRLHLLLELLYGECDERMRQEIKCSKTTTSNMFWTKFTTTFRPFGLLQVKN